MTDPIRTKDEFLEEWSWGLTDAEAVKMSAGLENVIAYEVARALAVIAANMRVQS